jgi:hypothetical protein
VVEAERQLPHQQQRSCTLKRRLLLLLLLLLRVHLLLRLRFACCRRVVYARLLLLLDGLPQRQRLLLLVARRSYVFKRLPWTQDHPLPLPLLMLPGMLLPVQGSLGGCMLVPQALLLQLLLSCAWLGSDKG